MHSRASNLASCGMRGRSKAPDACGAWAPVLGAFRPQERERDLSCASASASFRLINGLRRRNSRGRSSRLGDSGLRLGVTSAPNRTSSGARFLFPRGVAGGRRHNKPVGVDPKTNPNLIGQALKYQALGPARWSWEGESKRWLVSHAEISSLSHPSAVRCCLQD